MSKRDITFLESEHIASREDEENFSFQDSSDHLFDRAVEAWIDIKNYVEDQRLPWLDKKGANVNFIQLCQA